MGAELGATTSIFPSDEITKDFLNRQNRVEDFVELTADADAHYDYKITINLSELIPMVAKPHSPDNVDTVKSIGRLKVDQVAIGSCTNASYTDLMKVAAILKGKKVHADVSLVISPGSSNVLKMLADNGALGDLIKAGARILEASCGPCIGMGQAPKSKAISVRTFNRNFKGRCGTKDADVHLVSPETAAAIAVEGYFLDTTVLGNAPTVTLPEKFDSDDNYFIFPPADGRNVEIVMGPNIKPFPRNVELTDTVTANVILKTGDNVTTDDIMPSNAKLLPFRSNVPELSKYCFGTIVDDFAARSEKYKGGFVIGGDNYGQGSSREHAALVPLYLGVKAVIVKSFARIHKANLINSGIIPLEFKNKEDYDKINEFVSLTTDNLFASLDAGVVTFKADGFEFQAEANISERDKEIIKKGGYLNFIKDAE